MALDTSFFLSLLDQVKPNIIYTLSDPRRVVEALWIAEREMIESFTWTGEGLEATYVNGKTVRIVPQPGGRVVLHGPSEYPLYALAALITFFVIRKGSRLLKEPLDSLYRERLEKMIRNTSGDPPAQMDELVAPSENDGAKKAPPRYLLLKQNFSDEWNLEYVENQSNAYRLSRFDEMLRERKLLLELNSGGDLFENIRDYLSRKPVLPVCLQFDGELIELKTRTLDPASTDIALSHEGEHISLSVTFPQSQNKPVVALFNSEWGLTENGELVGINLPPLALFALGFPEGQVDPSEENDGLFFSVRLPTDAFNAGLKLFINPFPEKESAPVRYRIKGQDSLVQIKPSVLIISVEEINDPDRLRRGEEVSLTPALETVFGTFPLDGWRSGALNLYSPRAFVRFLQQPERRHQLFSALVEVAGVKNPNQYRQWMKRWKGLDWGGEKLNEDARDCLKFLGELFLALSGEHHWPLARPAGMSGGEAFVQTSYARRQYLLAELTIALVTLGKDMMQFINGMTTEHVMAADLLPSVLEELIPLAAEAGLPIHYRGMPVVTRDLQLVIHLERDEERLDWFQVNPEFFADGHLLQKKDWQDVLRNKGKLQQTEEGFALYRIGRDPGTAQGIEFLQERENSSGKGLSRLQIFDLLDLRRRGTTIELPPEDKAVLESLARFAAVPETPLPAGLQATLRPYQKEGYDWLAFLYQHRFGACLADDMGLGKTLQTIGFLLALKEGIIAPQPGAQGPHLLILPASLIFNWQAECARFAPSLRVRDYRGTGRQLDLTDCDCLLTTYEVARRDIERLTRQPFHVLIYDEAQALKRESSKRHRELRKIEASFRICLTGTPVENHVSEYQAILNLALPGLYTDLIPRGRGHKMQIPPERVLRRAAPFVLRRTKGSVLKDLPPKEEREVVLEMLPRQKALYLRETARVREDIAAAFKQKTQAQAGIIALSAINRLRQLCVHPRLLLPEEPHETPKFSFLLENLAELNEEGHAALVFSQYVKVLDLLEGELGKHHLAFCRLDGSTSPKKRQEVVQSFQKGKGPGVFLISLKAGGVGLNLTRASYVFHLDPWWNPAVENQASDRAHRIGQKQRVLIQKLVMKDTVEEKIALLKKEKAKLFAHILGSDQEPTLSGALTKEDFAFLLE